MVGLTLLTEARAAGLAVRVDGDRLIVRGPRQAEALARRLIAHKAEILTALAETASPTGDCEPLRPLPANWPELTALRWGPAVGDPTPGLTIDRPDPDRRRAALAALADDPEAIAERDAIRAADMGIDT